MRSAQFLSIFLVVFIVMLGFGLIMPLMPYYAAEYGGSALVVGLLVASYAAAQFVGAPLLGRLSDRLGRRPILAFSMIGTSIGFLLLALADPIGRALVSWLAPNTAAAQLQALQNSVILGVMFFSRALSGLTGGLITVASAYMADITDEKSRSMGMGYMGAAFGVGFILGPVIGGILSHFGYAVPAFAAAGLAALSLVTILILLPESLGTERKAELARQKKEPLISFSAILQKIGAPRVGPLMIVRTLVSLAGALFMSLFTLWTKSQLGLDAQATSYLLAYTGVLSIIVQILLIATLATAMLGWALSPNVPVLVVVLIPHSFATAVLNTVINSAITWAVEPQEVGSALGTAGALESLSRVIAPTVGGWMLGAVGMWAPGVTGAVLMAGLAFYAWQRLIARPDPTLAIAGLAEVK
jgi:DHA1 family tetracycline resistance protein-like MFS transporter